MAGCVDWMTGLVGAPPGTQSSTVSIDLSSEEQVALRFVELGQEIEEQMAMPAFDGTFSEYNTKVIQYGFVCMFASAFPPAAIAAAIANFVELRFDAHKIGYSHRRPVYRGAEDIGSWQHVMDVLSWLALVINVPPDPSAASRGTRGRVTTRCRSPSPAGSDRGVHVQQRARHARNTVARRQKRLLQRRGPLVG